MPIVLKEFDSYSKLQEKLENAIKRASERVLNVVNSMELIYLTTGMDRAIARYTRDGFIGVIVPNTLASAAVRLDDNVVLIPEQTALAVRITGWTYARTSSDAIFTGLRLAHRNKGQVISVLQVYVDQLEKLEDWTVEQDAINRKENEERKNGSFFGEQSEGNVFLPASDVPWNDPIEDNSTNRGHKEE